MPRRSPIALAALALVATGAAGCGGDDGADGLTSGDDFSIEAAVAELPEPDVDDDQLAIITVADLVAVSEANGVELPETTDDVGEWITRASGYGGEDGPGVAFAPPAETIGGNRAAQAEEFADELGWSVVDVEAVAEVVAPPFRFGVVAGDVDEDTFDGVELEDLGDGVVSAGAGEDLESDVEATSAARPIGVPLRMAAEDGRLATSSSTAAVERWKAGEAETLAEVEEVRAVAAALDEGDAISAMVARGTFGSGGARAVPGQDAPPIEEEYTVVGIGWAVEDGEPLITVAYAFADDAAAEDAAPQVEAAWGEGTSVQTAAPISDLVELDDVTADGAVVVARLRPAEDRPPAVVANMLNSRDTPFVHA